MQELGQNPPGAVGEVVLGAGSEPPQELLGRVRTPQEPWC